MQEMAFARENAFAGYPSRQIVQKARVNLTLINVQTLVQEVTYGPMLVNTNDAAEMTAPAGDDANK